MLRGLLLIAVVSEAATGAALLIVPGLVGRLLFGQELNGLTVIVARLAGFGLFSLGLACRPSREATPTQAFAMVIYNLFAAIYLVYLGIQGQWIGVLLWPAAFLHVVLSILLAVAWLRENRPDLTR